MYESHGGHRTQHQGCLLCWIVYRLEHLEREFNAMSEGQSAWQTQVQRLTDDWTLINGELSDVKGQVATLAQQLADAASSSSSAVDAQMASDAADLATRLDAFEAGLNATTTTPPAPDPGTGNEPSVPVSGDPGNPDPGTPSDPATPVSTDPGTPVATDPNDPNANGGSDTSSDGGTTGGDPVATGSDGTDQPVASPDSPTDQSDSTVIPSSDAN